VPPGPWNGASSVREAAKGSSHGANRSRALAMTARSWGVSVPSGRTSGIRLRVVAATSALTARRVPSGSAAIGANRSAAPGQRSRAAVNAGRGVRPSSTHRVLANVSSESPLHRRSPAIVATSAASPATMSSSPAEVPPSQEPPTSARSGSFRAAGSHPGARTASAEETDQGDTTTFSDVLGGRRRYGVE
jgi:hypothetical protein